MTDKDKSVNAFGEEFRVLGNGEVVSNALEELNRVDVRDLSEEQSVAYADSVRSIVWLQDTLDGNPYGATDD